MSFAALMKAFPSGSAALAAADEQDRARDMCAEDLAEMDRVVTEDIAALQRLGTAAARAGAELLRDSRSSRRRKCYACRLCPSVGPTPANDP